MQRLALSYVFIFLISTTACGHAEELNSLTEAEPGEISFLGNLRYRPQLAETLARPSRI